jgi:DNA-binding NarL/FixJ family response regulator
MHVSCSRLSWRHVSTKLPGRSKVDRAAPDIHPNQKHNDGPRGSINHQVAVHHGAPTRRLKHPKGGSVTPQRRFIFSAVPPPTKHSPITVALVDDYDVVVLGVANMLDPYNDRVRIAELDTNQPLADFVDIVLYDSFAQPESDHDEISVLINNPRARRVVIYTWNFHPDLISSARRLGVHGYLSKTLAARDLVAALEAVHAGDIVVSDPPPRPRSPTGLNWPGRGEGLTDRESEILALITQGKSNTEVATLTFLSPNTVKSYIRTIYRKINVARRTQAVLWGVKNGFSPDHHRIDHWRGGP